MFGLRKLTQKSVLSQRFFTSRATIADAPDLFKVNYTEEYNQGLTEAQKANLKRVDVYRANPGDPND